MFLTMLPLTEFFQERNKDEDFKVHLIVDMMVLTEITQKIHYGQIRFETLFPDVVKYCGQHKSGGAKTAPAGFSVTDGLKSLLMFVYYSMANFSDIQGDETIELKPFWNFIISPAEIEAWTAAIHDFGSTLTGYQNSEVSGGMEEEDIMNRI